MKKGQVTIFVVIGIMLLLVIMLFFALRKGGPEPGNEEVTDALMHAKATYETGVQSCFEQEGVRVFRKILSHGGYLDPANEGLMALEQFPTKATAVDIGGGHLVPYWIEHRGSINCREDCVFTTHIPPISTLDGPGTSIEERAEMALKNSIKTCLDEISFTDDYEVEMAPELDVDVMIGLDAVTYTLHRTVEFTYFPTGEKTTVKEATATSPAKIRQLYETAISLIEQLEILNGTDSLSGAIQDIIAAHSIGVDPKIPPMYGPTSFEANVKTRWTIDEVKEELQLRLADNLPLIQVRGSSEQGVFLDPNHYSQAIYHTNSFSPDLYFTYTSYVPRIAFHFYYDPTWPIELDISPKKGYFIEPEGITPELFPGFKVGIYEYRFAYDMRVPLLIVLSDRTSFDGEGITLLLAIETGLSGNEQIISTTQPALTNDLPYDLFSEFDQRLDGLIAVTVTDGFTDEPMKDVEVGYICGDASVSAGYTDENGMVLTTLPFCMGGLLVASLEGYTADPVPLDVVDDEDQEAAISLVPYKTYNLAVENLYVQRATEEYVLYDQNVSWTLGNTYGYLLPDDQLILIFTKQILPGQQEHVVVKNVNLTTENGLAVELGLGQYDIEAYLLTMLGENHMRMNVTIPEEEIDADDETVIIDATVFNDTMYHGGVSLLNTAGLGLTITEDDYDFDKLTVRYIAIDFDDLETHQDLEALGLIEPLSRYFNETLKPTFE